MKNESLGERFARIRQHYEIELPRMQAEHERTGRVHFDPYRLDFTSDMTPIETAVWSDIRCAALPFFPQLPVLGYFLDFADPFKKIAIECDGKQWHDAEKDAKRDARLNAAGWIVYRIPGSMCKRTMRRPVDLLLEKQEAGDTREEALRLVRPHAGEWFATTSEGIVDAIGVLHYGLADPFAAAGLYVRPAQ
ncbi:MAG: endonuclease domain-containing protein [Janthinobacterium lividum]